MAMQETFHFRYGNEAFFFRNKTFDLVCFLHFSGVELLYVTVREQGIWGLAYPRNLIFMNIRHAGFWHSGKLFALLQMPSLQHLKEFFDGHPLHPELFS